MTRGTKMDELQNREQAGWNKQNMAHRFGSTLDPLEFIHPSDYKEKAASVSPIWPYALEILAFSLKPSTV